MNRKQLTFILIAFVVLGALGLWLRKSNLASFKTTEGRMGQKALGDFDVNAVTQVTIKHGTNEVNLVKQDDLWTVRERGGYPANFTEVGDFLRKLWELKVAQPVAVGPSQLGRLELTTGAGEKNATQVDLKDKAGKPLRSLLLGKKHNRESQNPSPMGGDEGWPDGRYIMVDNQPSSICLVSESMSNIEPKPEQWLNKDFFKVEKVRSVAVTYPVATNSWKLSRETETGEVKLADAKPEEKIDTSKTSGIMSALSFPSFNDVVADPKPEVTGLDKPTVAVLETFDNFTYNIKAGNKVGEESYYMTVNVTADIPKERTAGKDEKPEDKTKLDKEFTEKNQKLVDKLKQEQAYSKATYLVSKWTLDSLLKERHALLAEKKVEPAKPDASATPPPIDPTAAGIPPFPAPPKLEPAPVPPPPGTVDTQKALPPKPPEPKIEVPAKPEDSTSKPKE